MIPPPPFLLPFSRPTPHRPFLYLFSRRGLDRSSSFTAPVFTCTLQDNLAKSEATYCLCPRLLSLPSSPFPNIFPRIARKLPSLSKPLPPSQGLFFPPPAKLPPKQQLPKPKPATDPTLQTELFPPHHHESHGPPKYQWHGRYFAANLH